MKTDKAITRTLIFYAEPNNQQEFDTFKEYVRHLADITDHTVYNVAYADKTNMIPLKSTTEEQFEYVKSVIEDKLKEWQGDPFPEEADGLPIAALFNFLCDLEVDGYELP